MTFLFSFGYLTHTSLTTNVFAFKFIFFLILGNDLKLFLLNLFSAYDGRHVVKFLTDIHADNFCENFLFFVDVVDDDNDFLAEFDRLPLCEAIFLTKKQKRNQKVNEFFHS